jgi:hypothetical protein
MTMRGWLHLLSDLQASFGPEARIHELPLGVLEANRIRAERAAEGPSQSGGSTSESGSYPLSSTIGADAIGLPSVGGFSAANAGSPYPSPAVPTAGKRKQS